MHLVGPPSCFVAKLETLWVRCSHMHKEYELINQIPVSIIGKKTKPVAKTNQLSNIMKWGRSTQWRCGFYCSWPKRRPARAQSWIVVQWTTVSNNKKHRKALQGPSRQPGGCLPTSHTKCIQNSLPQLILHEQFACSQATFRTTISCT